MTAHSKSLTEPAFQRALGRVSITSKQLANGTTGLQDLHQAGSYRAVFPRALDGRLEAVLVNTAGGVTGGDRFQASVNAGRNTQVTVTTQAAERIYRATGSQAGTIHNTANVAQDAALYWLPQETILFDGCRLVRRLAVDLAANARFLMLEPLVFGREASGEVLRACLLDDHVSITQEGSPLYLDRIRLVGDIAATLGNPAVANHMRAMANLVFVGPDAARILPAVRGLLPKTAGASLLNDQTLVMRLLCADSFALRTALLPILRLLTDDAVPKNWRL